MSKIKQLYSIEHQFKQHYEGHIAPIEYFSMEDEDTEEAFQHYLAGYKDGNDALYLSGKIDAKGYLIESIFHNLTLAYSFGNSAKVKEILDMLADWSYSIRRSDCNGEATEAEQLANVERAWSALETKTIK